MKSSCKGLEVFDFKDEEGIPEFAAAVYSSKFKASNAIDKYTFLENVAQGTNIPSKEIGNILCMDVDAINIDHNGDNGVSFASLDEGDDCDVKKMPRLDADTEINSTNSEQLPQVTLTEVEQRSFVFGVESSSSPAVALPSENKLNFALLESPSNDESTDVVSNADESMSERSPSTSSYVAEDDVPLDGTSPDQCFGGWEMGDGNMTVVFCPDYIVYRNRYCTDAVLTFSSSSIEIKGPTAYEDQGTFVFQCGLDAIMDIESQWCQRIEMAMVKIRVISKDAVQDEDVHGTSGIEELKFAVVDPDWYTKQEVITSCEMYKALWTILPDFDMERNGEALIGQNGGSCSKRYFPIFDEPFEDVIYPKGDADAVSISKRDVDLLQPDTFVNDTIIDFYMKYLKNKIQLDERQRFHFFNSFFFRKLADLDKDPSSVFDARAAFQRVRKWTRKVNLFEKEYIFIPVNFNYHWSLLVICHPGEVATFQDEDAKKSIKVPCIVHFDSIRGSHSGLKNLLQSYLWEEWKERHKETSEDISLRFLNLRFVSLELPQQQNSFDCGLFLLHYAELFLEEAPLNFNPFKITKLSKFLTTDWFQPAEASLKRVLIQRLICDLLDNCSPEDSPDIFHQNNQTSNCPKTNNDNEMAIEFLSIRSKGSDGNVVISSQADQQGIELTLLPTSSLKSDQCASSDSGLVLREFFEPEAAVGSLLDNTSYQAFNQTAPFEEFKCAMSPIEEEEEAEEHFVHSPIVETGFHQLSEIPPESHAIPQASQDFRAEPCWNLGISVHLPDQDDINSSPQTSIPGSHGSSEIKVNENSQQPERNLNSDEKTEQGEPTLVENKFFDSDSGCPVQTCDGNDDKEYPLKSLSGNLPGLRFRVSDMQENVSDDDDDDGNDDACEESALEPDEGRPVKKLRLTTTVEEGEGGFSRSVSNDLHL